MYDDFETFLNIYVKLIMDLSFKRFDCHLQILKVRLGLLG